MNAAARAAMRVGAAAAVTAMPVAPATAVWHRFRSAVAASASVASSVCGADPPPPILRERCHPRGRQATSVERPIARTSTAAWVVASLAASAARHRSIARCAAPMTAR